MFKQFKKRWPLVKEYLEALVIILPLAFLIRTVGYGLYRVPTGSMEPTMLVGERFFADKFSTLFFAPQRGDIITFNDPTYSYSNNAMINLFERYVWGPYNLTKRIIAVPGDHIQGQIVCGKPVIYLNDTMLEEPYVNPYPLIPIDPEEDTWRTYVPDVPFDQQPYYRMDEQVVEQAQRWYARRGMQTIRYPHVPLSEGQGSDTFDVKLAAHQYWVMGDNRLGSSDSRDWGPLDDKFIHGKIKYCLWSIDSGTNWWIFDFLFHPFEMWKRVRWSRSFKKL